MSAHEYHKLYAQSVAQNFLSLRQVEWQVAFQAYAGYAAIAVGYFALIGNDAHPSRLYGWIAIAAAIFVFFVTLYASIRVQERLHNCRRLEEEHLKALGSLYGVDFVTPNATPLGAKSEGGKFWFKIHAKPIHSKWYGFGSQTAISFAWVVGIATFVALRTGPYRLVCG